MQKFIMKKSALSYCTVMVNMRSALAEHGEEVAGRYILLCLYCAEQVNSGVIENCGEWSARQWMIRVGIDDRPEDIPGLWHWEDGNLAVDGYNTNGEAMALAKRQKGRDAANARWGNASSNAQSIPSSNAHCNTKERKGKERKEYSPSFPREVDEVVSHLKNEVARGRLLCPPDRLEYFGGLFLSDFAARGWCDKAGIPVHDWREAARAFVARCGDNERGRSYGSGKMSAGQSQIKIEIPDL